MSKLASAIGGSELLDLLADLISINSINPAYGTDAAGEGELGQYIADFYRQHKIPFERQEVLPGRFNIIGKVKGRDSSRCLIFDAHLDTVSVDGMSIEPFKPEVRDNRMYGRGSCDTKAGMAGMLLALKHVSEQGPPPTDIWVVNTIDEEYGFQGIRHLASQGIRADAAVIAEPTQLEIVIAHKGILRWRMTTKGRSAHSSKPELGVNAISKMAQLIQAIEKKVIPHLKNQQHPLLGPPTLSIGRIRGGVQVNLVPEYCEIDLDRRTLPGETLATVLSGFEALVRELETCDPEFKVSIEEPFLEDFSLETAPQQEIVRLAEGVCQRLLGHASLSGVPYGTNASKLSRLGIPSIVIGPGNIDQAHTAAEFVETDQVAQAAEIYAHLMLGEMTLPMSFPADPDYRWS